MRKILFLSFFFFVQPLYSQTGDPAIANLTDSAIYVTVDTVASFPGGRSAWNKFIEKSLHPAVGVDNGAKFGTYNVIISFVVTKEGVLKDFQPDTKFGKGFEQEVIRVLKLSPNWIPAKKGGVPVNSRTKQNQIFVISKGWK
jgi:hypothetical protein